MNPSMQFVVTPQRHVGFDGFMKVPMKHSIRNSCLGRSLIRETVQNTAFGLCLAGSAPVSPQGVCCGNISGADVVHACGKLTDGHVNTVTMTGSREHSSSRLLSLCQIAGHRAYKLAFSEDEQLYCDEEAGDSQVSLFAELLEIILPAYGLASS